MINVILNLARWQPLTLVCSKLAVHKGIDRKKVNKAFDDYTLFANWVHLIHGNNPRKTVKVLKELNSRARKSAAGYPVTDVFKPSGIILRIHLDGLPTKVKHLGSLLKESPEIALIITNAITLVTLSPEYDITTITRKYTGTHSGIEICNFREWLKLHSPKLETRKDLRPVMSIKAGPLGDMSTLYAGLDAVTLCSSPQHDSFLNACRALDLVTLEEKYLKMSKGTTLIQSKSALDAYSVEYKGDKQSLPSNALGFPATSELSFQFNSKNRLAKLSFLSDKAGKTRIVYILNWWCQQALLPFHDALMSWFKHQPQDATWDQDHAALNILEWTRKGKRIYSFDLTAATDRWPVWHQEMVISSIFGPAKARVWRELLSIPAHVGKPINAVVNYEVGQPMGAYASWASLNVTHHMVLRYLCWVCGVSQSDTYKVLGDDVVICHDGVAQLYKEYLDSLGIDISLSKSIVNTVDGPSSAEFAKHLLRQGQDLTPLSPIYLKEIYVDFNYLKFIDLLRELKSQYDIYPIVHRDKVFLPPVITDLLEPLSGFRDTIILIITSPVHSPNITEDISWVQSEVFSEHSSLWEVVDNPWFGYDQQNIHAALGHVVYNKLTTLAGQVIALKKRIFNENNELTVGGAADLTYGRPTSGLLLENPDHPFYWVLEELLESIRNILRSVEYGETVGTGSLLLDGQLVLDTFSGKELKGWKRNRVRHDRVRTNLIKSVYKVVQNPSLMWYDE